MRRIVGPLILGEVVSTREDTLTRITVAYRNAPDAIAKIGPAMGIAVLRAGLSFETIAEDIGYSKQTVYTWIFGRVLPHHSTHKRLRELTAMLEKATRSGGKLPVLAELTLGEERELLNHVRAQYDTVT